MRASPRRHLLQRLRASQDGFTLIEVLVAITLLTVGILALVGTFDSARSLTNDSEVKTAAVHRAQEEIDRLQSLAFSNLGLTSVPATSANPLDPTSRITQGSPATFKWDRADATQTAQIVTGGQVSAGPTSFSNGRFSGRYWDFVTWANDPTCAGLLTPLCPASKNYKRVTVVVQIDNLKNRIKPIWISSLISDPADGPLNSVLSPVTECLNDAGTSLVNCSKSLGGAVNNLFLTDTDATVSSVRQTISGNHATHPTIAPITGLVCTILTVTGCPKPDLLSSDPPPSPDILPSLFKYSTDVAGTYTGGRVLRRDTTCAGTPSTSDNTKGGFWTGPTLSASKTLNGKGGLSIFTQSLGGASATLCIAIYDVPGSLLNLISTPPTELGRTSYTLNPWPTTPQRIAFPFTFRTTNVTIAAGHRIGVRLWTSSSSDGDIAIQYDHPTYPTQIELDEP